MKNWFWYGFTAGMILIATPAGAQESCRAIDGDTIRCGDQPIRVVGVDTPEIFKPEKCSTPEETQRVLRLGYAAKGRVDRLLTDRETHVVREGFDKYGRIVARVFVGTEDIAVLLVQEGLGRTYECKNFRCPRRQSWCK